MNWSKWLSIVQAVTPLIITAANPALGAVSGLIVHAIGQAETEASPTATGADKKAAAMQIISDGINVVNTVKGTQVVDPAVVTTASDVVDDVVEAANQLHNKTATVTVKPAV